MDILEEQAQLGPSLGQEAHRLDAMTQTLGQDRGWTFPLEAREETLELTPSPI
jgi:hypothetical protein